MRKLFILAILALGLAACGGDGGPTAPPPPRFAEIAGTWDFSAPINELPGARFSGTLNLVDDSQDTAPFSGAYSFQLLGPDGTSYGGGSGSVVDASVNEAGQVILSLGTSEFQVGGSVAGRTMSGSWFLRGGTSGNYSGPFTASRR